MTKIVIIGAGSGFGSRLSIDILSRPHLQGVTIALCDINEERLFQVRRYVQQAIDAHKLPATVVASTDRHELLPGADFVVTAVSIGGPAYWGEPYASEMGIPDRYGISQSVGDTIGPGGVFRFLRTADEHLQSARIWRSTAQMRSCSTTPTPCVCSPGSTPPSRASATWVSATASRGPPKSWPTALASPTRRSRIWWRASTTKPGFCAFATTVRIFTR